LLQAKPQIRRIKDFAVVDDPHRLPWVRHRLVAVREIQNAEPPHAQAELGRRIIIMTAVVRATMDK
jgi:hypothetical protein